MGDTKERILMTALHLFARDGYEAVSVRTIAEELGMTKGALYRHYKNKRDIFDSIVERMNRLDTERAEEYQVPAEDYQSMPKSYEEISPKAMQNYTLEQLKFWTEDEFATMFRRMLTLEQYRNAEMAELYSQCIVAGPVAYMEDIFREWMKKGMIREDNPRQLAVEYFAPLFLLMSMSDKEETKEKHMEYALILQKHTERFMKNHGAQEGENK